MMLSDGHHVLRAGLFEDLRPPVGVKIFRFEHRDKILVSELRMTAIRFQMMRICPAAFDIHHARVPFTVKRRNRKDPVMNEDPEPQSVIPLRHLIRRQRIPVVPVWPLVYHSLYRSQFFLHIIVFHGMTPSVFTVTLFTIMS